MSPMLTSCFSFSFPSTSSHSQLNANRVAVVFRKLMLEKCFWLSIQKQRTFCCVSLFSSFMLVFALSKNTKTFYFFFPSPRVEKKFRAAFVASESFLFLSDDDDDGEETCS